MDYINHIAASSAAIIGAVGVVLAAVWGVRSKAITLLRADLETYKEHVRILENENRVQAERIRVLETELAQLQASTNLSPLLVQLERLVDVISSLEGYIKAHDEQAKVILAEIKRVGSQLGS